MGFESFNPIHEENTGSEDVKKEINAAFREADPTTYSKLPPGEDIKTKFLRGIDELNAPLRKAEGETYYELGDLHDPRGQQVVARMLKGVLNVSDIISASDEKGIEKYYSWKIPLKKMEQTTTPEEIRTDQLLLEYLFNSKDHLFNPHSNWANNARYEDEKVAHFDFGEDAYNFLENPTSRDSLVAQLKQQGGEARKRLQEKVSELKTRFNGESGKEFLRSIIGASGAPIKELFGPADVFDKYPDVEPFDLIYQVLTGRIEGLSKLADELNMPSDKL